MRLPVDQDVARSLVEQTFAEDVIDSIKGPAGDAEKALVLNLATAFLSEGPIGLVSPAGLTRWFITNHQLELSTLSEEVKQVLFPSDEEDVISRGGLLLEKYLKSLMQRDDTGQSPITHYGEVVNQLEQDSIQKVAVATARLFLAAYQKLQKSAE